MIDSPDALKELLPNVSRETIEKLAEFREMILEEDQNLISKNDKNFIWIRHFYDSLRLGGISTFSSLVSEMISLSCFFR